MQQQVISNSTKDGGVRRFLAGNIFILLATIFWAVNIPVVKALVPRWMTADSITVVRIVGACILFWIASLFIKQERIARNDWWRIVVGGAAGLFGFIYLLNLSIKFANPIDVSIIMTLPPVFVVLIGVIFLKRRPSRMEYIGIVTGLAGAVLVIVASGKGHSGSHNLLGDLIALASTLCYSAYLVITEKPSHTYHPVSLLKWTFLAASIPALCLLGSFRGLPLAHTTDLTPWLEIVFVLLCPSFIAYFLLSPALKDIGSELVSLFQYLLPVFATLASVIMGLAHLHWVQVVAMAIIIAGMLVTNLGKRRRNNGNK